MVRQGGIRTRSSLPLFPRACSLRPTRDAVRSPPLLPPFHSRSSAGSESRGLERTQTQLAAWAARAESEASSSPSSVFWCLVQRPHHGGWPLPQLPSPPSQAQKCLSIAAILPKSTDSLKVCIFKTHVEIEVWPHHCLKWPHLGTGLGEPDVRTEPFASKSWKVWEGG